MESESEESSDLVSISTTEATEAGAESEEKEIKLFWSFWLRFRWASDSAYDSSFWFTLDRNAPCASDSDSASDSVASVNQPLIEVIVKHSSLLSALETIERTGRKTTFDIKCNTRMHNQVIEITYNISMLLRALFI